MVNGIGAGSIGNKQLGGGVSWSFAFEPSIAITAGRVDKLGLDIRSFREPLTRSVREVMTKSLQRNFDEGGRPPWEPQSEATIEIMRNMGVDGQLMIRSGKLRKVAGQINLWTFTRVSATVRELPEKVWYGAIHQTGYEGSGSSSGGGGFSKFIAKGAGTKKSKSTGPRGVSAIPARPWLIIQPEDIDAIHDVFARWLQERIDRDWSRRAG